MSALELDRAKFALEKINSVKGVPDHGKYRIELRDLPARLHSAGLGQTVASLLASRDDAATTIYEWLEVWLSQPPVSYPVEFPTTKTSRRLIDCIVARNPPADSPKPSYMTASREARALATWLKKFAEAFIAVE
jgi:CRISPR/Cas system CMR-associated protein Cmr5 small subunit